MRGTLVIRPEKMGDLVAAMPAIRALKGSFPDEPLWLFTDDVHAELARSFPSVDHVASARWKLRNRGAHAPWKEIRALFDGTRFARCAILYDHCPGFNRLAAALRIPRVAQLGFTWPAPLLGHRCVLRRNYREPVHYAEYYVRVAQAVGAAHAGLDPALRAPAADREELLRAFPRFAASRLRLVVHPFYITSSFNFSRPAYLALCRRLAAEFGERVFLVGSEKDAADLGEAPPDTDTELLGRLTLRQLQAALSLAGLVVGGPSGVIHVAAALGRPAVSLYCASHNHHLVWGPLGPRSICLTPPPGQCKRIQPVESGCGAPAFCDLSFGITNDAIVAAARKAMALP